jgi:transposase
MLLNVLLILGLGMSASPKDDGSGIRFVKETTILNIPSDLEECIPTDHLARTIKAFLAEMDFSVPFSKIQSRGSNGGRPAFNPRTLAALWLYAYQDGITCARKLEEACCDRVVYMYLAGLTQPNYHTLSDFRTDNDGFVLDLFQKFNLFLVQKGLLNLDEVTLDGRRIKANASRDSLHRKPTLDNHFQEAKTQLEQLRRKIHDQLKQSNELDKISESSESQSIENPSEPKANKAVESAGKQAAQMRAATEKYERIEKAQKVRDKRAKDREKQHKPNSKKKYDKPEETRASETDADARKMKLSNGGYTPAYNVQTVVDTENGFIVGTMTSDQGNDNGLLEPVIEKIEREFEQTTGEKKEIKRVVVDGGYASKKDIEQMEQKGTKVYGPPPNCRADKKKAIDPYKRRENESKAMGDFRERMGQEEAKTIFKKRSPIAEGVHAHQRNRGFTQMRLRGLKKVELETTWQALAYNVRLFHSKKYKTKTQESNRS